MLRRLALPIGVVILLVAIALVSLRLGYLGRRDGGPLKTPNGFALDPLRANPKRWTVAVAGYVIDDGSVRISAAKLGLRSPGMRVRGPRIGTSAGGSYRARSWPPRGDRGPAVGARLRGEGGLAFGLRIRRPGTYVLWDAELEYERGARSFRRTIDGPVCVTVRSACPVRLDRPDPDRTPVADVGGPSDYAVRLKADDPRPVARYPARAGAFRITVPLTNVSDERVEVRNLLLRPLQFGAFRLRSTTTTPFALDPGESRQVTLDLAGTGCERGSAPNRIDTTNVLSAEIDGAPVPVPLMAQLTPVPARSC